MIILLIWFLVFWAIIIILLALGFGRAGVIGGLFSAMPEPSWMFSSISYRRFPGSGFSSMDVRRIHTRWRFLCSIDYDWDDGMFTPLKSLCSICWCKCCYGVSGDWMGDGVELVVSSSWMLVCAFTVAYLEYHKRFGFPFNDFSNLYV